MNDSLLSLKTSPNLLQALRKAGSRPMSAKDLLEQRISFVYGSIDSKSGVTRDRIRQLILEQGGATQEVSK